MGRRMIAIALLAAAPLALCQCSGRTVQEEDPREATPEEQRQTQMLEQSLKQNIQQQQQWQQQQLQRQQGQPANR